MDLCTTPEVQSLSVAEYQHLLSVVSDDPILQSSIRFLWGVSNEEMSSLLCDEAFMEDIQEEEDGNKENENTLNQQTIESHAESD